MATDHDKITVLFGVIAWWLGYPIDLVALHTVTW